MRSSSGQLEGPRVLTPQERIGAYNFVRNELHALKRNRLSYEQHAIDFVLKLLLKVVNRERKELGRAP